MAKHFTPQETVYVVEVDVGKLEVEVRAPGPQEAIDAAEGRLATAIWPALDAATRSARARD